LPLIRKDEKINPADFIKQKRKVNVNDLLGREEIIIHDKDMKNFINNKIVMVTGGGGSIGSELCRQIATLKPSKLIILDVYENNAYEIQQELKIKYKISLNLIVEIATIRDNEKIDFIFNKYKPQIVFHAAAHKHVPLMESNPEEAIKNNVFGTNNVINACNTYGVENFILISSDKAVNPTNIMGATKRICEMMVQSMKNRSKTIFSAVRFGNVLGSNGSVIPLFKRQIENGGPVTVTDKNMVRYFMTIPEAVSLVMEAARYSKGGEVFVLDMGKPVNIDDFARKLIKLSGYEPDKDIEITYTGLRPGEKMYEELILNKENSFATENDKIFIEKLTPVSPLYINNALIELKEGIQENNIEDIKNSVKIVVDTYKIKEELTTTNDEANLKKIMNENLQDLSIEKRKAM
jgi:FlaA1/EpsC-like NDP-sugar epimerase